jgi:hypothetical protein
VVHVRLLDLLPRDVVDERRFARKAEEVRVQKRNRLLRKRTRRLNRNEKKLAKKKKKNVNFQRRRTRILRKRSVATDRFFIAFPLTISLKYANDSASSFSVKDIVDLLLEHCATATGTKNVERFSGFALVTMSSNRIDYSKWDKLVVSDDDDDNDDQSTSRKPKVTRFDAPKSVQFGGNTDDDNDEFEDDADDELREKATALIASSRPTVADSTLSNWSRNGVDCGDVIWSQSADAATLRVRVPSGTRAKQVAVRVEERSVVVTIDGRVHFNATLKWPVDASDDAVSACWELADDATRGDGGRVVAISLRKVSLVAGAVQWWAQLRDSDAPLDVTVFADRRGAGSFANVWNEAHAEFKRRIAERTPIEIDAPDDDDTTTNE